MRSFSASCPVQAQALPSLQTRYPRLHIVSGRIRPDESQALGTCPNLRSECSSSNPPFSLASRSRRLGHLHRDACSDSQGARATAPRRCGPNHAPPTLAEMSTRPTRAKVELGLGQYLHPAVHQRVSDQKITQYSSDPTTDDQTAERKSYLRVMAPSSFAMSSDNISNMSNASSQISSSSSQGVVKKRSQTLSTQPQQQPQQPQQPQLQPKRSLMSSVHQHTPKCTSSRTSSEPASASAQHQHQQPLRHDTRYTFQEDLLPRISSPLLEEEQQVSIRSRGPTSS